MFAILDTNHNGEISQDELAAALQDMAGMSAAKATADAAEVLKEDGVKKSFLNTDRNLNKWEFNKFAN